jgi:Fic family protein
MISNTEKEFLIQSNLIEGVDEEGLADSIAAWEYIKKKDVITERTILHVHKLIMRNLWPEIAGKFRKCNVRVGGRICPDWRQINCPSCGISSVVGKLNCNYEGQLSEDFCKRIHVLFEHLHPHRDGNGRVGRILYNWQRLNLGLPVHIIKFEDRFEYYGWF